MGKKRIMGLTELVYPRRKLVKAGASHLWSLCFLYCRNKEDLLLNRGMTNEDKPYNLKSFP